jgi:4-hydroxybenzoate polyprenyltransferase
MRLRRIIGVILVMVGGVWVAQGTGSLGGSFMTGEGLWTVIGFVFGLFGIALLTGAARDSKRTSRDEN